MQSLATEIEAKTEQEKISAAISRIEAAVNKIRAKDSARTQIMEELDHCIAQLEDFLNNSKEK